MNLIWQLFIKFKPQILQGIVFIFFGIFVIAILAQFTNFPKVLSLILESPAKLNFAIIVFLALYYFLKFQVERFLISKLKLKVTAKRVALLFAVAEMAREFPTVPVLAGIVAATKKGERFFPLKMFSALIPQLPLELAACFLILAIFGFGNLPFFKLGAFLVFLLIFVFLFLLKTISIPKFLTSAKSGVKQKIGKALTDLKEGLVQILIGQNLVVAFFFIFFYVLSLATVLYFVAQASGFESLSLTGAWAAAALIYIALVFSPFPADWGVSESSGFVLLSFLGASREAALASMLTFRIVFSTITYLVISAIFWFLWSEIRDFIASFVNTNKQLQDKV